MFFLLIGAICSATVVYKTDAYHAVKDAVKTNYNRYKMLSVFSKRTGISKSSLVFTTMKLVFNMMCCTFIQKLNNRLVAVDTSGKFVLTYVVNGRMYRMLIKPPKGPCPVLQIINDVEEDVTDTVRPFMGPKYDWYGEKPPLDVLGYSSLTLINCDGEEQTFEK
jgi:hypothetical protein